MHSPTYTHPLLLLLLTLSLSLRLASAVESQAKGAPPPAPPAAPPDIKPLDLQRLVASSENLKTNIAKGHAFTYFAVNMLHRVYSPLGYNAIASVGAPHNPALHKCPAQVTGGFHYKGMDYYLTIFKDPCSIEIPERNCKADNGCADHIRIKSIDPAVDCVVILKADRVIYQCGGGSCGTASTSPCPAEGDPE